jgi:MarR family transcriptional regulator, 2-MHQ and catechol-resistance regulon repressor
MVQPPPPLTRPPGFVPEEADVLARVAGLPVDLGAMAVGANLWRAAQAVRGELERTVLRPEGLSFTGFSLLFNLWVWGPAQTRTLAASMGCSRATVSSVSDTLERGGLISRADDEHDGRLVQLALTPVGEALIEDVFPRFNAGESALVRGLDEQERQTLAALLRKLVTDVRGGAGEA